MAGDGINISTFSQRVQDFIKEQKIDVDDNGTINKAELAQLLSAAKADGIEMTDLVDFSGGPKNVPYNPNIDIHGIQELADTIVELNEAKEQDQAEFDTQIMLLHKALEKFEEARENDKIHADEFTEITHIVGKKDEEKYQARFDKLSALIPDDAVYYDPTVHINVEDDEQPIIEGDEGDSVPDDRLNQRKNAKITVSQAEGKNIKADLQELAENTLKMVKKNSAERSALAEHLNMLIEEGRVDEIKMVCQELLAITHAYAKEAEEAMENLVNIGMEALKSVVLSASSDDLENISNLTNTIQDIKEEAMQDQKAFVQFMNFIEEKIIHLEELQQDVKDKLKQHLHMMVDTLMQKADEIEGRFDKVLTSFDHCVEGDVHDDSELGARYDAVEADKGETVDRFRDNSDKLHAVLTKIINKVDSGDISDVKNLGKMLIYLLMDTNDTQTDAMDNLENKALDFLHQLLETHVAYDNDNPSSIADAPTYNGQKINVTPKKIEKDGQMVVAKPVQINGEWKVQISQMDGISTYDNMENYPIFFVKE